MPEEAKLALHEMLELHELLRSEVVSAKKLKAGMGMVRDPELRSFMVPKQPIPT